MKNEAWENKQNEKWSVEKNKVKEKMKRGNNKQNEKWSGGKINYKWKNEAWEKSTKWKIKEPFHLKVDF